MSYSHATERKIRIITEAHGDDWALQFPSKSIDAIYNEVVGETRKTVYAKISADTKEHLDHLTQVYNVSISEFLESLIEKEYRSYQDHCRSLIKNIKDQYSGS